MNKAELALRLLDLTITGLMTIPRAQEMYARIKLMVDQGAEPSPAEWANLFASIEDESKALDAADKRLNP